MSIELGDKVKDSVTGFTGIVIAATEYLHGCRRLAVQPDKLDKDGKTIEAMSFDEPQLVLLKTEKVKAGNHKTGGPRPDTKARYTPKR